MARHDGFLKGVSMTRLIHLILYGEKITLNKHLKQCFRTDLILKIASDDVFVHTFLHGNISYFTRLYQHVLRVMISE